MIDFLTIEGADFDSALQKGREQYGSALRIHSRKDVPSSLFRKGRCILSCYLVQPPQTEAEAVSEEEEQNEEIMGDTENVFDEEVHEETAEADNEESPSSEPDVPSDPPFDGAAFIREMLSENDFSRDYTDKLLYRVNLLESRENLEIDLVDELVNSVAIDRETLLHPKKYFVILGPTGVGKTTTLIKIALLYRLSEFRVCLLTLDSFRAGAYSQIQSLAESFDIPLFEASDEDSMYQAVKNTEDYDLVLVDTMGKSPKDSTLTVKLSSMLSVLPKDRTSYYLALSASHKRNDMDKVLNANASFDITSLVITKCDETDTIGNVLSFCDENSLPLLFFADGQKIPDDLHKASSQYILSMIQGFSFDFSSLNKTQTDS